MCFCPLCDTKLSCYQTNVCKQYFCASKKVSVNNVVFSHYELMKYPDNSVCTQYVIEPFQIYSQLNETTILLLHKVDDDYDEFISTELATHKYSLMLFMDNIEEIKNKIKRYTLFI